MNVPTLTAPTPSGIQILLDKTTFLNRSRHPPEVDHLTLQVAYNLHFQHSWTDMRIHYYYTRIDQNDHPEKIVPRPMVSGNPPHRLYIHPDEQLELLRLMKDQGQTVMPELRAEREWVLPTHLKESWSLRRFAEIFDKITVKPVARDGESIFAKSSAPDQPGDHTSDVRGGAGSPSAHSSSAESKDKTISVRDNEDVENKWRTTKRVLMATLEDDSTVVYYIVHDGIVKPRQNG